MSRMLISTAVALLIGSLTAQAELHDRGGGLIYDDVLNVTWLQDANYAYTSGHVPHPGRMTWPQAMDWAENLGYYDSVRNVTWTDWRLPKVAPVGADWNMTSSCDGTTDFGTNIRSPRSEVSYMFYVNLTGTAFRGEPRRSAGVCFQ